MKRMDWLGNGQLCGSGGVFGIGYENLYSKLSRFYGISHTIEVRIGINYNVGIIIIPSKGDLDETI